LEGATSPLDIPFIDRIYTVTPATLYCLRQQGTSPLFIEDFARPGEILDKRKKKYRSAEGSNHAS
jgi:hypothetical protein